VEFRASGKLLITAEYSVLRGALALSIPTRFGQQLTIEQLGSDGLQWQSIDEKGAVWFESSFLPNFSIGYASDLKVATHLLSLLKAATELNPQFSPFHSIAASSLEFNPLWGLGSSSTLVSLIAQWAGVNALDLFFKTSVGSGYDVATAMANAPITYQLSDGKAIYKPVIFDPPFKHGLHFLYLGKKQRSTAEVLNFKDREVSDVTIKSISKITSQILACTDFSIFQKLILEHETLTSKMLGCPTVKQQLFADFDGEIKSLGAWGGDFVLLASTEIDKNYFYQKGFKTILSWDEMIGM
jgi:mevalonate kinase